MICTLYILWYAERAEATSNSEKIKAVALAIIELACLKESGMQEVSQAVENSVK